MLGHRRLLQEDVAGHLPGGRHQTETEVGTRIAVYSGRDLGTAARGRRWPHGPSELPDPDVLPVADPPSCWLRRSSLRWPRGLRATRWQWCRDRPRARGHRGDDRARPRRADVRRRQLRDRGGSPRRSRERIAACVAVHCQTRADVDDRVKRLLDVRKASFLSMDRAVEESAMEYGGITPVGLPTGWRLLVDARVLDIDVATSAPASAGRKLLLPGRLLAELPGPRSWTTWPPEERGWRHAPRPTTKDQAGKFADILQELRVVQTGVQLTAGYLLDPALAGAVRGPRRRAAHNVPGRVVLAGWPAGGGADPGGRAHRLSGHRVKDRVVQAAHRMARTALAVCRPAGRRRDLVHLRPRALPRRRHRRLRADGAARAGAARRLLPPPARRLARASPRRR